MCSQSFYVILKSLDLSILQHWMDNIEAICPIINILKIWRYCVGVNKTFLCTCQRFAPHYPLISRKSAL